MFSMHDNFINSKKIPTNLTNIGVALSKFIQNYLVVVN